MHIARQEGSAARFSSRVAHSVDRATHIVEAVAVPGDRDAQAAK